MKPYYSDDWVTLYHADCREVLAELVGDVLVTDPPYGIGLKAKRRSGRSSANAMRPEAITTYRDDPSHVRDLIDSAIVPLIERTGRAVVFPGPHMMFAYPEPRAAGCVFTANGSGRSSWGFQLSHPIFYYGKDPYGAQRPNGFWDTQADEPLGHPCAKPIKWMQWAVARASTEGETVIDPFAGSGTTLRAAKDLGRRAIGVELEERYCEIAVSRLAQEVLDLGEAA